MKPFVSHRNDCAEFIAGDQCHLRELLHPQRSGQPISYSLAYAFVEQGGRTLDHTLEQSEVYYIIAGRGTMFLDGQAYAVETGSFFYIPPQCNQWIRNDGPSRLEFLCIVDPPWTEAGEQIKE